MNWKRLLYPGLGGLVFGLAAVAAVRRRKRNAEAGEPLSEDVSVVESHKCPVGSSADGVETGERITTIAPAADFRFRRDETHAAGRTAPAPGPASAFKSA
jgi:hypothetical protein